MKNVPKNLILAVGVAAVLLIVMFSAACSTPTPVTVKETVVVEKPVEKIVEKPVEKIVEKVVTATPAPAPAVAAKADLTTTHKSPVVPALADWQKSGHADFKSVSFTRWPSATEPELPVACAKCHSSEGYRDFLGADGSKAGVVDKPAPGGSLIDCVACHNTVTANKTSVTFPSGITLKNLGSEARCMECHQGREAKTTVDAAIARAAMTDTLDAISTVSPTLGFVNIHYYAAAATLYGTLAKGGYEYDGKRYEAKFEHVEGYETCTSCHNPHTLEVEIQECAACHTNVKEKADLAKIRMVGSLLDYDGDGDAKEGIPGEIAGFQEKLYSAIVAYAKEISPTAAIGYSADAYPYWFKDTNGDGKIAGQEATVANRWPSWTPRLLKAAYNYQVSKKDPGEYAHNGKYIIQLLYDSIEDLNNKLTTKVDLSKAHRDDAGHFSGAGVAFRYWDAQGEVPAQCVKCHTAGGLPEFLKNGGTVAVTGAGAVVTTGVGNMAPSNGFACTTCHTDNVKFGIRSVVNVPFPSGKNVTFSKEKDEKGALKPVAANLCLECHQGRASTTSVNAAVRGLDDDKVDARARFQNIHYYAAGASLFGDVAQGAYQYEGKKYVGQFAHAPGFDTCTGCHNTHELELRMDKCVTCHVGVKSPKEIRFSTKDYDGDQDVKEGISAEVMALEARLYEAIVAYSKQITQTAIVYNSAAYPYFFKDLNGDGKADAKEAVFANGWADWTPRLLRAAYNYQYIQKDPGVYAHNPRYAIQILYDTLEDLGKKVTVNLTGLVRPE